MNLQDSLKKWPNVPACYEWLSLDRRGHWRLQGERITHAGLTAFLNQNYTSDEDGCWFVQNGPQRVFVDLAITPWVYRHEQGGFVSHTGQTAGRPDALYLDPEGNLLVLAAPGIGLLDDRDLCAVIEASVDDSGNPVDECDLNALLSGESVSVNWQGIRIQPNPAVDLEKTFNFVRQPRP